MVKLYGASYCAPCKAVKAYFESEGIEYTYFDIEEGGNKKFLAEVGIRSIPVVVKEVGEEVDVHVGSNIESIKKLLGV